MKVVAKTAFYHNNLLYKKGDKLEVETASFNPINMVEIPETRIEKKPTTEKVATKKTTGKKTTKKE